MKETDTGNEAISRSEETEDARYSQAVYITKVGMVANAWHHRSDAFSSIGTMIGIGSAILLGGKWVVLDPIAAIILSFFIFKVAFDIS